MDIPTFKNGVTYSFCDLISYCHQRHLMFHCVFPTIGRNEILSSYHPNKIDRFQPCGGWIQQWNSISFFSVAAVITTKWRINLRSIKHPRKELERNDKHSATRRTKRHHESQRNNQFFLSLESFLLIHSNVHSFLQMLW